MKIHFYIKLILVLNILMPIIVNAQYAPAAGKIGSTAIHKDSSIICGWAKTCVVQRGFINIADTNQIYTQGEITSNKAFFGNDLSAIGVANGTMDVVSLGDGGTAVITFKNAIRNGEGVDFAVFENGFQQVSSSNLYMLELAFVEVSTNGINYVRFPSVSLTQTSTQIEGFGALNPEELYNLAGKYEANYGTPFDLEDLKDSVNINIDSILYLKIIDVVGNINSQYASYDSQGNKINDPWSTPFWSCGFDLDAVAVIHFNDNNSVNEIYENNTFVVYPNPIKLGMEIYIKLNASSLTEKKVRIYSVTGNLVYQEDTKECNVSISTVKFEKQMYILQIEIGNSIYTRKIIIQ